MTITAAIAATMSTADLYSRARAKAVVVGIAKGARRRAERQQLAYIERELRARGAL